jgi:O-antigen/teichoic acid export membrane protein
VLTSLVIILKVALSLPFVKYGNVGVLVAAILSALFVYGLYFIPLKFIFSSKANATKLTLRQMSGFAIPTLLSLLGITSIYTTDIILVRHYFSSYDAGLYASLAILGKIIFYASSSVALVLFPVLSERSAKGTDTNKLIRSAVMSVAAISLGITILYFVFPGVIVGMLFGASYKGAGAMLGLFGIFIAFFSIANIVINSSLAIGKTGIWIVPIVCSVIQIIAISIFHQSILTIIWINIITALFLSIGSIGYYYKPV